MISFLHKVKHEAIPAAGKGKERSMNVVCHNQPFRPFPPRQIHESFCGVEKIYAERSALGVFDPRRYTARLRRGASAHFRALTPHSIRRIVWVDFCVIRCSTAQFMSRTAWRDTSSILCLRLAQPQNKSQVVGQAQAEQEDRTPLHSCARQTKAPAKAVREARSLHMVNPNSSTVQSLNPKHS